MVAIGRKGSQPQRTKRRHLPPRAWAKVAALTMVSLVACGRHDIVEDEVAKQSLPKNQPSEPTVSEAVLKEADYWRQEYLRRANWYRRPSTKREPKGKNAPPATEKMIEHVLACVDPKCNLRSLRNFFANLDDAMGSGISLHTARERVYWEASNALACSMIAIIPVQTSKNTEFMTCGAAEEKRSAAEKFLEYERVSNCRNTNTRSLATTQKDIKLENAITQIRDQVARQRNNRSINPSRIREIPIELFSNLYDSTPRDNSGESPSPQLLLHQVEEKFGAACGFSLSKPVMRLVPERTQVRLVVGQSTSLTATDPAGVAIDLFTEGDDQEAVTLTTERMPDGVSFLVHANGRPRREVLLLVHGQSTLTPLRIPVFVSPNRFRRPPLPEFDAELSTESEQAVKEGAATRLCEVMRSKGPGGRYPITYDCELWAEKRNLARLVQSITWLQSDFGLEPNGQFDRATLELIDALEKANKSGGAEP